MSLKTTSSMIAFAAITSLSFGSTAVAQTMVGDQDVSDADLEMVTAHCEMLAADTATGTDTDAGADTDADAATEDLGADEMTTEDVGVDGAAPEDTASDDMASDDDAAADDTTSADAATDEMATDDMATDDMAMDDTSDTAMVDLDAITVEDCEAAGLTAM